MALINKDLIQGVATARGSGSVSDEVASALATDVDYRLREIIQEARKFMIHSKRTRLTTEDFNLALRMKDFDTLYGYSFNDPGMFIKSQKDSYIVEEREIDVNELASRPLPPVPQEAHFTTHWLAIEGQQPRIPQNPLIREDAQNPNQPGPSSGTEAKPAEDESTTKPPAKHVLSRELQTYFQKVTEALESPSADYLGAAMGSVAQDPGLHQLLPYFTKHIGTRVTANLQHGPNLMALMALVDALISNPYLHPEPYVHQLIPAVLTCVVGKRLASDKSAPEKDQWALRDFAAKLAAKFVAKFGKDYDDLQPRITKTFLHTWMDPTRSLAAHYGAIRGIVELGRGSVHLLIVPHLSAYVAILRPKMEQADTRHEATQVYNALLQAAGQYLRSTAEHYDALKRVGVRALTKVADKEEKKNEDAMDLEDQSDKAVQPPPAKKARREPTEQTTTTRLLVLEESENIAERYREFADLFGPALQPLVGDLAFFQ